MATMKPKGKAVAPKQAPKTTGKGVTRSPAGKMGGMRGSMGGKGSKGSC